MKVTQDTEYRMATVSAALDPTHMPSTCLVTSAQPQGRREEEVGGGDLKKWHMARGVLPPQCTHNFSHGMLLPHPCLLQPQPNIHTDNHTDIHTASHSSALLWGAPPQRQVACFGQAEL